VRVFLTGGSGVLGRVLQRKLASANHDIVAPRHYELDLYNLDEVTRAAQGAEAVYHLATRIPPPEAQGLPGAWEENDRLRHEASRILVDAAIANGARIYVQPSVTFIYPEEGVADEDTPVRKGDRLGSMLEAERQTQRFTDAGGCGVVLRFGLLWGATTGLDDPDDKYGATLHISDAGTALLAALTVPAGIYNVVSDGGRISNTKFKAATGWRPAF
jgi:nucleoside-diphosphate-sugar epimerase